MICALPFLMLVPPLPGVALSADDIMCRVAENQERARAERTAYVYDMNIFVRLKRANGRLAREESRDYTVAPTERGARRKLVKVEGKILDGVRETTYTQAQYRTKDMDIDGALTDSFARTAMWGKNDMTVMLDWFPLTRDHQKDYSFHLDGEDRYHDYDVYKISFEEQGDRCWAGEALVEKREFQPVMVTTHLACRIPTAVKIMLGTNVTQLGAKIGYQRFDTNIWFPVTCGGEMKLRVLFLYARTIAFTARNSGFRKADVQSSIEFDKPGTY